jgi:hypothetical protein
MTAQFVDAQPDRNGETHADHRDSDGPSSDRADVNTGLPATTTPPPDGGGCDDRHGNSSDRTA